MCGLTGALSQIPLPIDLIDHMVNAIKHRGPDGTGIFRSEDGTVILGHTRLSIIDLSDQNAQPFFSKNKKLVIVFNGEIYNFESIKKELQAKGHIFYTTGDTEVILEGYEEWGADIFNKIEGMFAIALWDSRQRVLFLTRDTYGIKPLYYFADSKKIVFGSEIKSIFSYNSVPKKYNINSLIDLVSYGYQFSYESAFEGIQQVPPGKYLKVYIFGNGIEFSFGNHKQLSEEINKASNKHITADDLCGFMQNSVKSHLISDAPLAMSLSGGLDSSTVCALASKINNNLLNFTIGYNLDSDETPFAKLVSNKLNLHQVISNIRITDAIALIKNISWNLEEPIPNIQILTPFFLGSILRSRNIKVLLLGEGSDELFAGYPWHILPLLPIKKEFVFNAYNYWRRLSKNKIFTIFSDDYKNTITKRLEYHSYEFSRIWELTKGSALQRFLHFDSTYQLVNSQLLRVDKMLMANSIEGRVPFLHTPLLSQIWNIKDNQRIRFSSSNIPPAEGKIILRQAMEKYLPNEVTYRRKFGRGGTQNLYDMGIKKHLNETLINVQNNQEYKYIREALGMINWKHPELINLMPPKTHLFLLLLVFVTENGLINGFQNKPTLLENGFDVI